MLVCVLVFLVLFNSNSSISVPHHLVVKVAALRRAASAHGRPCETFDFPVKTAAAKLILVGQDQTFETEQFESHLEYIYEYHYHL